jgi:hypothetical protein
MLHYQTSVQCHHCLHTWTAQLVAEGEPPPDTIIRVRCPKDGGPIPVPFHHFKSAEPFPPTELTDRYPPRPRRRGWQFWKA